MSLVILLNLLIKPLWLLLENMVQNDIGHDQYGVFSALFSLSFLFVSLSDLGINYYITQRLSIEPGELKSLFSNVFSFKIFLVIVYPVIIGCAGWLLRYSATELYFLVLLSFTQALLQFVYFFRANFQASQHFSIDSVISIIDKVLLIGIVLILMNYGLSLRNFILGRLLSVVLTFALAYACILHFYGWIKPSLNMKVMKQVILFSWPFALISVLYSINEKIDQVMIERIYGAKEAGLYAAAYRWLDAFLMYIWTVMPIFFAKFSFNLNNRDETQKLFNSGQIICSVPFIYLFCFIYFYGDKFFMFLSNSSMIEIGEMTVILKILVFSALLSGFFSLFSTLLNSTGFVKPMSIAVGISIIINMVLNFVFIPKYGAAAAAVATGVSSFFLSVVSIVLVMRQGRVTISRLLLVKLSLIFLLTWLCFYILNYMKIDWMAVSIYAGIGMIFFTLLFRLRKYLI
ncbi:MAG: oligosaccharide flippase family protein [Cytophagaceae bacterium]